MKFLSFKVYPEMMNPHLYLILSLLMLIVTGLASSVAAQRDAFEAYYLRSANYPDFPAAWTPTQGFADRELQGVAHDDNHWYFTWTDKGPHMAYLWQVPVDVPLNDNVLENPRVVVVNIRQYAAINGGVVGEESEYALWHWGDPDYCKYEDSEFIVVPMDGAGKHCIGIFQVNSDSSDIVFIGYSELQAQDYSGWCAVHPISKELYSSDNYDYEPPTNCNDQEGGRYATPRILRRYSVPWETLAMGSYAGPFKVTPLAGTPELRDRNGQLIELYNMQGGEFTETGEMLYLSCGSGCCYVGSLGGGDGQQYSFDGVYAFDTQTWFFDKRSLNHRCGNHPLCPENATYYFDYYYRLGCDGAGAWSPEGLTIWDLDDQRAPNIDGQLHVLAFHFRRLGVNRNVFEHFGGRIYVDPIDGNDQPLPEDLGDEPLPGGPQASFQSFGFAMRNYPAWDGAEIILKPGNYYETGKFESIGRVRIVAPEGPATIGGKLKQSYKLKAKSK